MEIIHYIMPVIQLYDACHSTMQSLAVIQLLVSQYPKAVEEKNCLGEYPLHIACWTSSSTNQSLAIIQYLVKQYPNALYETNKREQTPLWLSENVVGRYRERTDNNIEVRRYLKQAMRKILLRVKSNKCFTVCCNSKEQRINDES